MHPKQQGEWWRIYYEMDRPSWATGFMIFCNSLKDIFSHQLTNKTRIHGCIDLRPPMILRSEVFKLSK